MRINEVLWNGKIFFCTLHCHCFTLWVYLLKLATAHEFGLLPLTLNKNSNFFLIFFCFTREQIDTHKYRNDDISLIKKFQMLNLPPLRSIIFTQMTYKY